MKKIKLQLIEIFTLNGEIENILKEKLTILTKYTLSEIRDTITPMIQAAEKAKNDFIIENGVEKPDGTTVISQYLDEEKKDPNPKFENFNKEWSLILSKEKEIKYTPIKLSLIENIETTADIKVLFKLCEK